MWECSLDLVDYIKQHPDFIKNKTVIELGCGQGLPGVMALKYGAEHVCFQDFNQEVLDKATVKVIQQNMGQ